MTNLRLYTAESAKGSRIRVERTGFKAPGVPSQWITDKWNDKGEHSRSTFEILEYTPSIPGTREAIFGFNYPTNYVVTKSFPDGRNEFVQNPMGVKMYQPAAGTDVSRRLGWPFLLFCVLSAPPVAIACFKLRTRRG